MRRIFEFLLVALVSWAGPATAEPKLLYGPMVGYTGPHSSRIWIKADGPAGWHVVVGERADLSDGLAVAGPSLEPSADYMATTVIEGLSPSTTYYYRVEFEDGDSRGPPIASFKTAPPAGTPGRLRFAFGSCIGTPADMELIWRQLASVAPVDMLLQLGDNTYANSPKPEIQRAKYYEQRGVSAYRDLTAGLPTMAIWDDHDFAHNNSDGTAQGKEIALRTFRQIWPNPSFGQATDPGVYFTFSHGEVDFFMLDARYHRSPNDAEDRGQKTMLGPEQLDWLKKALKASTSKVKFIADGSSWHSNGREDSWASFMRERDDLFDFIESQGIEGVVFLSGDRHFTAGFQMEGRFIEITSGSFGGRQRSSLPVPEMFLRFPKGNYFSIFDIDTRGPEPRLVLEVHKVGRGLMTRRLFTWEEINGDAKLPQIPLAFSWLIYALGFLGID